MAVSYSPALDILPELLISGVLAFMFYSNFKKSRVTSGNELKFILVREGRFQIGSMGRKWENRSPIRKSYESGFVDILRGSQTVFLSVTLWVVLTMLMIPVSKLFLIVPRFGAVLSLLVYGFIAFMVASSVVTTIVTRVKNSRMNLILLLATAGSGVFISFYLPLMNWASGYGVTMRLVFVYCAVAITLFGIYYAHSIMKEKNALRFSVIGSYLSYFSTSALLLINLMGNLV